MHSKIYQISNKPISEEDYIIAEQFYENHEPWADYIGEEVEDEDERIGCIANLSEILRGVFKVNRDLSLTYLGKEALCEFLTKWADDIHRQANNITADNILQDMNLFKLSHCCTDTHIGTEERMFIENWNGWAGPFRDLITYAAKKLKEGDHIYVGAIIDFHC